MAVLELIDRPSDLRLIRKELLSELAQEIREKIIKVTSQQGGHLASSLGTVELTIALHYVFDSPQDMIVWDVGHQAYAHKILTGRRNSFSTLRQHGGISGFPTPEESEYDTFGVGHSSTAISAALGMACARDLSGNNNHKVVAVIGDGSMTGGMAFEALNNAGHLGKDLLVILNDNEMFISHRVGALAGYLTKLMTLGLVKKLERKVKKFLTRVSFWGIAILRVVRRFKVLLFPGMLFEEMGFSYLGPIDGHKVHYLIEIFQKVKDMKGPVLIHVVTKKGKGYQPAEREPIKFHGTAPFNILTGETEKSKIFSYTEVFGRTLIDLARSNEKIIAITAAMPQGTGLDAFEKEFPKRYFDVGIAEQHAVTFAAGLAKAGYRPVCAIYSTFLQRAFDQIIDDVCLQNLPVVFAIDRAGIVGEDGATHQGTFDLSYLRLIPNMVVMAPKDENELVQMLNTALSWNFPCAIRFPRGAGVGVKLDRQYKVLPLGKGEVLAEGNDVAIMAIGNTVHPCLLAQQRLEAEGIKASLVNMRFVKPLDEDLIKKIIKKIHKIVTVEENTLSGGFGSGIKELLATDNVRILSIGLPDKFIEHGSREELRKKYGLTSDKIAQRVSEFIKGK
ncbi:MAG: 1-deoxy-D-xylulose-5-phosphate synthase [Elusimicrobiota bacterium]|nr:1-deoxy-D-xylulose-5-phosphate synthase [Elusimicrobiota bacterium]